MQLWFPKVNEDVCPWRVLLNLMRRLDPVFHSIDYNYCVKDSQDRNRTCGECAISDLREKYWCERKK